MARHSATQRDTARHSATQRGLFAVLLISACPTLSLGCASHEDAEPSGPGSTEESAAVASQELAREPEQAETASANSVEVVWQPNAEGARGQVLKGEIRNNTDEVLAVELAVVSQSPRGDVVQRPLGVRRLRPKSSSPISLPVAQLPAQSVGLASATTLVATYPTKRVNLSSGAV